MSVPAHFETIDEAPADRRVAPRLLLTLGSVLESTGSSVLIQDLSPTGLLIETSANLAPSDTIEVRLPEMGATRAKVIWREGSLFGCEFEHPIPKAAVSAALLHSEPRPRGHDLASNETRPGDRSGAGRQVPVDGRRIGAGLAATLVLGGLAYLVLTGGTVTLVVMAVVLVLLVSLLVLGGMWIMNNTL